MAPSTLALLARHMHGVSGGRLPPATRSRHGRRGSEHRGGAERRDASAGNHIHPDRRCPRIARETYYEAIVRTAGLCFIKEQLGQRPDITTSIVTAVPGGPAATSPAGNSMDVRDALRARRTVRSFLARPVPRETIEGILADALCTPSWANTQPWEVFVAGGEAFERIRRVSEQRTLAKIPSNPDVPFPGAWTPECRERTKELTAGRAEVRGTSPEDPAFHHDFLVANRSFFGAPCAVYLCMDQTLGTWSIFDLGAMCQSITLAAQDHGVDSAIAINLVVLPRPAAGRARHPQGTPHRHRYRPGLSRLQRP